MSAYATTAETDWHRRMSAQTARRRSGVSAARMAAFSLISGGWIAAARRQPFGPGLMCNALGRLAPLERDIIISRRLLDDPLPLEALARRHRLSLAEIAHLEATAFADLQRSMQREIAERRAAAGDLRPV